MGAAEPKSVFHKHTGPVIGTGFVCPTEKSNHDLVILSGWRAVRRCNQCSDVFSNADDLIESGVTPSPDVVQKFQEQEGRPVKVAG